MASAAFLLYSSVARISRYRSTGFAGHDLVAWQVSIWLSVLRQPAHHRAAPKCHAPSPCGCPSFGGQCTYGAVASHSTWHPAVLALGHHCLAFASSAPNLAGSRPQVLVNRPACRRSASIRRLARCVGIRQNYCQSKGVFACQGQTSVSKIRLACSHRQFLLAPA